MKKFFKSKNIIIKENQSTILCGIINVTPDSFSDGGKYNSVESALARALQLVKDGAGMLDIGGESTRPGSTPVPVEEEIKRICPVIEAIKNHPELKSVPISVDTWKAEVAEAAIKAGADIVNDITGFLGDKNMASVVGKSNAGAIIMFNPTIMRPNFEASKNFPKFGEGNAFSEDEESALSKLKIYDAMMKYFEKSLALAKANNIPAERIMLDPGIGFALTKKENLELIKHIDIIHKAGYCSFLGVSRKRFIVNMLDSAGFTCDKNTNEGMQNIDYSSAFLTCLSAFKGVSVLRVHDIPKHRQAQIIADSVRLAENSEDVCFKAYPM